MMKLSIIFTLLWPFVVCFAPLQTAHHTAVVRLPNTTVRHVTPKGRVEDMDAWIQLSSDSLKKITGKSLFDYMEGVTRPDQVHDNERYAVLSHGTQDDPIYCYFNKAALQQFQWTENEIYSLPSRYSAPDGADRTSRQIDVEQAIQQDLKELKSVIRQTKHGDLFEMLNVLLWNVYDGKKRVGQTALYDRELVRPIETKTVSNKNSNHKTNNEE
ncbi:MEKHLA domain containing protein [Nitzschia inconspicua]|uniref:MEKHLA domain containing protein n=1 Tax=Nitzschia inconspicua TaxID=303405 RepID=A0A9K3M4R4_9STRA|nr:MEKHLA domain containing protein [Nitzschia inconspicua]